MATLPKLDTTCNGHADTNVMNTDFISDHFWDAVFLDWDNFFDDASTPRNSVAEQRKMDSAHKRSSSHSQQQMFRLDTHHNMVSPRSTSATRRTSSRNPPPKLATPYRINTSGRSDIKSRSSRLLSPLTALSPNTQVLNKISSFLDHFVKTSREPNTPSMAVTAYGDEINILDSDISVSVIEDTEPSVYVDSPIPDMDRSLGKLEIPSISLLDAPTSWNDMNTPQTAFKAFHCCQELDPTSFDNRGRQQINPRVSSLALIANTY